jgi:hypothetical protein
MLKKIDVSAGFGLERWCRTDRCIEFFLRTDVSGPFAQHPLQAS